MAEKTEAQQPESEEVLRGRISGQDRTITEMKNAEKTRDAQIAEAGFGTLSEVLAAARRETVEGGRGGRPVAEEAAVVPAPGAEETPAAVPAIPELSAEDYRTQSGELDVARIKKESRDEALDALRTEQKSLARESEVAAIQQAAKSEIFSQYRGESGVGEKAIAAMIEDEAMTLSPSAPANAAQLELATKRAHDTLDEMTTNRLAQMDAAAKANLEGEPPGPGGAGQAGAASETPPPKPVEEMSLDQLKAHAQSEGASMLRAAHAERERQANRRA